MRLPVPDPAKPDYQTSELYTDIKRMIALINFSRRGRLCACSFLGYVDVVPRGSASFSHSIVSSPAFEANSVLKVLNELCYQPALLAGFKRGDLNDLHGCTFPISEPHLDNGRRHYWGI